MKAPGTENSLEDQVEKLLEDIINQIHDIRHGIDSGDSVELINHRLEKLGNKLIDQILIFVNFGVLVNLEDL